MAGWDLKTGNITDYTPNEDKIWSLFNFVFSEASKKRNTYKFGLIKSILDNIFNGVMSEYGVYFSYKELFEKFAENYWNLVVKYNLRQMRPDGKSVYSKIEQIFRNVVETDKYLSLLEYENIPMTQKQKITNKVTYECKKYVIGALYSDFDGVIYSFDINAEGIILNYAVYEFMQKYKLELEKLNYYSWAKFLEQVNEDNALIRVIDKLELATPKRNNLSIYRDILRYEFEENRCFYCGKKFQNIIHVDHFIPWSFVKDDKMWNFVLSCSRCNERKNNKIPRMEYLIRLENRNKIICQSNNSIVKCDFKGYSDELLDRLWKYAKHSGIKEYSSVKINDK